MSARKRIYSDKLRQPSQERSSQRFGRYSKPLETWLWQNLQRRMPTNHLTCKIRLIIHLFQICKKNRIKSSLLNLLSLFSLLISLMQFMKIAPYVASLLALVNSITLGYLAFCQHANLVYLNEALVTLCQRLPDPRNEEDSLQD